MSHIIAYPPPHAHAGTHTFTHSACFYIRIKWIICLLKWIQWQCTGWDIWFTVGLVFKVRTVRCYTTKFFHGNDIVCLSRIEMKQISSVFTFQIFPVGVFVPSCLFLCASWGICVVWLPVWASDETKSSSLGLLCDYSLCVSGSEWC